LGLDG
jgi:hypothetical protein